MDPVPCEHFQNYKQEKVKSTYRLIHGNYVACISKNSRKRKATEAYCHDCLSRKNRLHACFMCVYFGCFENNHMQMHAEKNEHYFAVDIKFGNIFCFKCNDYTYDEEFEAISRSQKKLAGQANGIEICHPWEPLKEDIDIINQNGGFKKICDTSCLGLRGLINLGNTCFMNCIVQVLVHTPVLRDYFLSDKHICHFEETNKSCLACEMYTMVQEFYSGKSAPLVLSKLVYLICIHAKHFVGCQQDAHEFLMSVLNILHAHCQKKEPEGPCRCIIHQIFTGFYQSDIECPNCKQISTTIEPFWDISLNSGGSEQVINGSEQCPKTLLDCISRYTQPESILSVCPNCNERLRTKQLTVKQLPVVTWFHIKRLEQLQKKKNSTHIMFPECLDMSPFITTRRGLRSDSLSEEGVNGTRGSENKFTLFAVVCHYGTVDGGHYFSYIRLHRDRWYKCNDAVITRVTRDEVLASEGYLLFYHKQVLEYGVNPSLT